VCSWLIKPNCNTLTWTDQTCQLYCIPNWSNLSTVLFPELIKPVHSTIYWNRTIVSTVLFPELNTPVHNTFSSTEQPCLHYCVMNWTNLSTMLFPEVVKSAYITVSWTEQTCLQYCFLSWSNLPVLSCLPQDQTCHTVLFAELIKLVYNTIECFKPDSSTVSWTDQTCLQYCFP
jgi:hypothetical protein